MQASKGGRPAKRQRKTEDFTGWAQQLARELPENWADVKLPSGGKKRALMSTLVSAAAQRWTALHDQVLRLAYLLSCVLAAQG